MSRESFILHTELIEKLPEDKKSVFIIAYYEYASNGVIPQFEGLEGVIWSEIQRRIDQDQQKYDAIKKRRKNNLKQYKDNTQDEQECTEEEQTMSNVKQSSTKVKLCDSEVKLSDSPTSEYKNTDIGESKPPTSVPTSVPTSDPTSECVCVRDSVSESDKCNVRCENDCVCVCESGQTPPKATTHTQNSKSTARFVKPTVQDIALYVQEASLQNVNAQAFFDYYESNGWRVGGKSAMKDWKAAVRNWARNEMRINCSGKTASAPNSDHSLPLYSSPPKSPTEHVTIGRPWPHSPPQNNRQVTYAEGKENVGDIW